MSKRKTGEPSGHSPHEPSERLKRKPCGKLVASYTVLGVAETGLDRQIEFSIPPWQAS